MKNKLILILFISIFSALFFVSPVLAETYNIDVPVDITNLSDTQLQTMITTARNSDASGYSGYMIKYQTSTNPKFAIIGYNTLTINGADFTITNCRQWNYNSDYTSSSFYRNWGTCNWHFTNSIQNTFILWSSKDIFLSNFDTTYNYTYIDKTFTQPNGNDLKFYSISEIRDLYYTDPMPLLTNFFTLVIDKLELVCQFFTSSYIYLSIFVIFIFYFVILLIRRLI